MKITPFIFAVGMSMVAAHATASATQAPDLDLVIQHYSKVLTPEGVTRETRYEEKMLRRATHVWIARVLPAAMADRSGNDAEHKTDKKKVKLNVEEHQHKQFNYTVMPRHVMLENGKVRVEYINRHEKEIVSIPVSEYDNVNFDGSWRNTYYLLDPDLVKSMPLSGQYSAIAGARWRVRENAGLFQRVLWDDKRQIPMIIESGDNAATFYHRVEIKLQTGLTRALPWQNLHAYAQKEYADFLD